MKGDIYFNCCTGCREPDWRQFSNLELGGCCTSSRSSVDARTGAITTDSWTDGGQSLEESDFFTVYGRFHDGSVEAITDINRVNENDPAALARKIAAELEKRSGLKLESFV